MELYLMYILGMFKFKGCNGLEEYLKIEFKNSYRASEFSNFYNYIKW
ncbi:hypothetical protein [Clostridium sp. Cult2]|nr:hypothetical protein [Clostridium sp. Cult2]